MGEVGARFCFVNITALYQRSHPILVCQMYLYAEHQWCRELLPGPLVVRSLTDWRRLILSLVSCLQGC